LVTVDLYDPIIIDKSFNFWYLLEEQAGLFPTVLLQGFHPTHF